MDKNPLSAKPMKEGGDPQSTINDDKTDILRKRLSLRKRPEDVEYIGVVANIFKNIVNLEKSDRKLLQEWIDKLEQQRESAGTRQIRNEYAQYLEYMMQNNTLHFPFNKPPPEDKKILGSLDEMMKNCKEEFETYKEFKAMQGGLHH